MAKNCFEVYVHSFSYTLILEESNQQKQHIEVSSCMMQNLSDYTIQDHRNQLQQLVRMQHRLVVDICSKKTNCVDDNLGHIIIDNILCIL